MCWTYGPILNKLPEDGTLVPKHVVDGTYYEVFYDLLVDFLS